MAHIKAALATAAIVGGFFLLILGVLNFPNVVGPVILLSVIGFGIVSIYQGLLQLFRRK